MILLVNYFSKMFNDRYKASRESAWSTFTRQAEKDRELAEQLRVLRRDIARFGLDLPRPWVIERSEFT